MIFPIDGLGPRRAIMMGRDFRLRLSPPRFAALSCCVMLASLAYAQVTPTSLTFLAVVNGSGTAAQTLTIVPLPGDQGQPWTATTSTANGVNWLTVQPQQGAGSSTA